MTHASEKLVLFLILLVASMLQPQGATAQERGKTSWRTGTEVHIPTEERITEPLSVSAVSVTFDGISFQDITLAGINVNVSGIAEKKTTVIAANADLPGTFQDSLSCYGANVVLSGTYNGNVSIRAANLTITPAARINGNLSYATASIQGLENATIAGTITQVQIDAPEKDLQHMRLAMRRMAAAAAIGYWFLSLCALLLTGALLHGFFPQVTGQVLSTMSDASRASIGTGFTALVAVPATSLVIALTIAGIPVAAICMVSYGVLLYISQAYTGMWLGKKIFHRKKTQERSASFADLLSGTVILWLIGLIPVFGWLLNLFLFMLGMGALLQIIWQSIVNNRDTARRNPAN
ncbi:hypothetical protein CR161_04480 [Prosthecochloris sp. ZM]|uniref:DUF8173 domain-containing protein n=1 Tax=Prosthecochloris aestuarii (strain DSM 271 / SK 413) TaxID=290512 RepID=B4S8S6_PROA2|nr:MULTISPECIES: polymer-forming cytoskeletal protein [Prosthecochloris]ACF46463.1 hypothetical protein Paes_1443 [Prosthecochloris aestuarii DSM 271]RDD30029.1 hypothetical protein CR161_04480 [Prosthecochloris sp. ZM]